MRVIVLQGKPFDFVPDGESNKIVGVTLHCVYKSKKGYEYAKFSAPVDVEKELANGCPGIYNLETEMAASGNKTVVRVVGMDFVEHVNLDGVFLPKAGAAKVA